MTAVDARLRLLPHNAMLPLARLLEKGLVSERVVDRVLDAHDAAGRKDPHHLVGFATAYLYMESLGIPVGDTIDMALRLNGRVRLDWSPKRWEAEHDQLSSVETLHVLSAKNVRYDIDDYRRRLPDRFPGYLIRSSRRLAMEGLRQRHCIAAHDGEIEEGRCAAAAVFVGGSRWTALVVPDGPDRLRIDEIRRRANVIPNTRVRNHVHAVLGIELPEVRIDDAEGLDSRSARERQLHNLRRILPVLRDGGVENVTIYFDGSGDDGCVDEVMLDPDDHVLAETVVTAQITKRFVDGGWTTCVRDAPASVEDALKAIGLGLASAPGINWWDGEGGHGSITIDVASETIEMEIHVRSATQAYADRLDTHGMPIEVPYLAHREGARRPAGGLGR